MQSMFYYVVRTICLVLFKILFRYRIHGKKNLPEHGAFIIASNHMSFLDPPAIGILTHRKVNFMARQDLFKNRIFGFLIKNLGAMPLDRDRHDIMAIRKAIRLLRQNKIVVVFPEGRRSPDGELGKPLSGVELLARKTKVGVLPVYLEGSERALPLHARFIRLKRIRAFVGRPVKPETDEPSGELIRRIWQEMHRLRDNASKLL